MSLKTFTIRISLLLCLLVAISSANPLDQSVVRNKRFIDLANVFGTGSSGGLGGLSGGPLGFIKPILGGALGSALVLKKAALLKGLGLVKLIGLKKVLSTGNLFGTGAAGATSAGQQSGVLSFLGKRR